MHLGQLLLFVTVSLLVSEIVVVLALLRLSHEVRDRPGGHVIRVMGRSMSIIVAAQFIEVYSDFMLDAAPEGVPQHGLIILIEVAAMVLVFAAIAWAWIDLTRFHGRR